MSRRTFLVTGATGDTGGATVEQILARGHHVRALAHRQDDRAKRLQGLGAEVVFGDFLNLDDVRAALLGVAGAYFCYPIRPGIIHATAVIERGEDAPYSVGHPFDCSLMHHERSPLGDQTGEKSFVPYE